MIHIETVETLPKGGYSLLKPKRSIKTNDTLIFEDENKDQLETIVTDLIDRPGLIKGWVIVEYKMKEV